MPEMLNDHAALQQAAQQVAAQNAIQQAVIQQNAAVLMRQPAVEQGASAARELEQRCATQVAETQACGESVTDDIAVRCENMIDALAESGVTNAATQAQNWQRSADNAVNSTLDKINEFLKSFSNAAGQDTQTLAAVKAEFAEQAAALVQQLALDLTEADLSLGADVDRILDEGPDQDAITAVLDAAQQELDAITGRCLADIQRTAERLGLQDESSAVEAYRGAAQVSPEPDGSAEQAQENARREQERQNL